MTMALKTKNIFVCQVRLLGGSLDRQTVMVNFNCLSVKERRTYPGSDVNKVSLLYSRLESQKTFLGRDRFSPGFYC